MQHEQNYSYKRLNHLKEKLNIFKTNIPDDVYNRISLDLTDKSSLLDIRLALKKHGFVCKSEYSVQIHRRLTNKPFLTLSDETESTLVNMFEKVQKSFVIHCPTNRSNFLSYSYVLHKLFKILKMNDHADCFRLFNNPDKLREYDMCWNKICLDNDWI
jgi:hypothetical protein